MGSRRTRCRPSASRPVPAVPACGIHVGRDRQPPGRAGRDAVPVRRLRTVRAAPASMPRCAPGGRRRAAGPMRGAGIAGVRPSPPGGRRPTVRRHRGRCARQRPRARAMRATTAPGEGDARGDAICESVFVTPECETIDRHRPSTPAEAQIAVLRSVEGVHNPSRRHSSTGCMSPTGVATANRSNHAPTATTRNPSPEAGQLGLHRKTDRTASATDRSCDPSRSTCRSFATISSGASSGPFRDPPTGSKAYVGEDHSAGDRPDRYRS